jgi:hypothetical protein
MANKSQLASETVSENSNDGTEPDTDDELFPTRDDLLEALANRRRRYALHYLQECAEEGEVELMDVSSQVAAWEMDAEPEAIRYSDRKNVHTALYQFHAPKMDDIGLIDYDKRSGTVELTECGTNIGIDLEYREDPKQTAADDWQPVAMVSLFGVGLLVAGAGVLPQIGPLVTTITMLPVAIVAGFWAGVWFTSRQEDHESVVKQHPPPPVEGK